MTGARSPYSAWESGIALSGAVPFFIPEEGVDEERSVIPVGEVGGIGTAWEAWVEGVMAADAEAGAYRYLVVQQERGKRRVNVGRSADGLAAPQTGEWVRLKVRVYPRVTGGKPWDSLEWLGEAEYVEVGRGE